MMLIVCEIALIYTCVFFLALIFFGIFFSYVEKVNTTAIFNTLGLKGLLLTGMVGTVIHEFSHLVFCKIFHHKVTEFALFRPLKCKKDGVFGYVNHTYSTNNKYQMVGNFFIGIAPIIGGTIILILTMILLLPNEFSEIASDIIINIDKITGVHYLTDALKIYGDIVKSTMINLSPFRKHNLFRYLIFLYLLFSITTHMDLSREDLQNSKAGLLLFFVCIFIMNFMFIGLGRTFEMLLLKTYIGLFAFLTVCFAFSLITLLISFILKKGQDRKKEGPILNDV